MLWGRAAEAAVEHLVRGQGVAFAGRLEPRAYSTRDGEPRVALEVFNVDLEYLARARRDGNTDQAASAEEEAAA